MSEQELFEEYMTTELLYSIDQLEMHRTDDGYAAVFVDLLWQGWRARADYEDFGHEGRRLNS